MPSNSNQFPDQFGKIGKYTIQKGSWELPFDTPAKANAFKTSWYAYVRLLKSEGKVDEWVAATRVKARTKGAALIFEDRNTSEVAQQLDAIFADLETDEVDKAFREMMESKQQLDKLTITPLSQRLPLELKVFHVRVFRLGEDADEHPDTGDYNEASIHNLFAIYHFMSDEVATVDNLDKGEYCVIRDINIRRL